jgi:phage terminase large subunit-like protein
MDPEEVSKRLENLSPLQRAKALEALEVIRDFKELNPLYFYNHPILSDKPVHWKQLAFHAMQQRDRYFFGGNQSGKTTAGLVDDIIQAIDWDAVPEHLKFVKKYEAPCFIRILTTDMVTLELTVYQKIKELVPKDQLAGGKWDRAFNSQTRVLRFANGSMIQFMTYKQDTATMGGATLHRVHYDEEPPRDVWEENNLRIMRRSGDQIMTMTPLQGLTWTYNDVWMARDGQDEVIKDTIYDGNEMGIIVVDMDDNPHLSAEDKFNTLRGYPPEAIEARKKGKFIHFAGMIYSEFSRQDHVFTDSAIFTTNDLDQLVISPHVNVVVGIDPGIRNRCAVIYAALTSDDKLFIFDEIYEQGKTIGEVCKLIHLTNSKWQVNPLYYVIDPAARNRNNQTGRSDQMEFSDHGIVTIAGQHAIEAGINRVKERLRNHRLYISSDCSNIVREFEEYRWREAPQSGEDGKPQPVKTKDHAMDALRYLVMSRPYVPEEYTERNETPLQKLMREDQEKAGIVRPTSSFGGGIFV